MVSLKTSKELLDMKLSCQISAQALKLAGELIRPGVSTAHVNKMVHEFIVSQGAKPTFLGYGGFPAACCISVNDEVIHGIPSDRIIREGDIVSVDVGAAINGYTGDNAATFAAGVVSDEARKIMEVTEQCLYKAIEAAQPGNRLGDVGYAVQSYAESFGFAVVRDFVGHGVGKKLHEAPEVPNYGTPGRGLRLMPGMTLAIEPMINVKGSAVKTLKNGTVLTASGSLSAHFEHTIAITADGPVILTKA
ncbi:MAG: type I methionyl aminopeptidase [Oscillospiraceae bacterium]|nr:type I methionyl aminopeptidase [Oscillospiraceae bacterium]